MKKIARIAAVSAMALSFALPASAATVAELQAQINALMAQLSAMSGGASTGSSSFTTDLTVGSKGAEVSALQDMLINGGYLSMPAGVAKGYFGAVTKAAVIKWQTAKGVSPAAGYFGAKSRAAAGSVATTGTTGTTTVVPTGISTTGVEGTITVTSDTVSNSTIYSGDMMAPVLAFKAKAMTSDIAIQRVKIDLGTVSNIYSKVYSKIYLVDSNGTTLASSDLNSNTVVKDSDNIYYITLSGFSSVVPKDTTRSYTVKVDVRSISSGSSDLTGHTVRLAANGVRGTDGAGIDQYSPAYATDVSKSVTVAATLADSASLTLSTGGNTPLTQEVIAANGSNSDQQDKVTLLTFDIQAKKDNVQVTDLVATVSRSAGAATASSTYLYVGDTLVGTATLSTNTATFSDINYTIAKDTTKTFTLKADIQSAGATQTTITASVANSGITAENSNGDNVTSKTGSATSNSVLVRNVGPVFSLVGTPTIVKSSTSLQNNNSTSTAAATFNLHIKAVGAAILFGSNASTTFPMVSNGTGAPARSFVTYLNGASNNPSVASTTDWTVPSSGVTNDVANNTFTLAQDQEVTIPVTFTIQANLSTGAGVTYGSYALALERINWLSGASGSQSNSTFMAGQTAWRTSSVTLP